MSGQTCWKFKVPLAEELGYLGEIFLLGNERVVYLRHSLLRWQEETEHRDPCCDITRF